MINIFRFLQIGDSGIRLFCKNSLPLRFAQTVLGPYKNGADLLRKKALWAIVFCILLWPAALWSNDGSIFIDPGDPTLIRRAVIPFESEILLRASELPTHSEAHPNAVFGTQIFSHLEVSPDGQALAFSVDGSLSDWSGLYFLATKTLRQVSLSFDAKALAPHWAIDGQRVVFEQEDSGRRHFIEIYDLGTEGSCRFDGRLAKNKYLDFLKPWWNGAGDKVYFEVHINNAYRRSLGLKPIKAAPRVGEIDAQCRNFILRGAQKFTAEFPAETLPQESETPLPEEMP
ncbi:MAG TPA: hypothetical protein DF383_01260 [Deltaproteobacteria bacterium]|nr:hypothetical protein [Deltaproteobacteria bacterium]